MNLYLALAEPAVTVLCAQAVGEYIRQLGVIYVLDAYNRTGHLRRMFKWGPPSVYASIGASLRLVVH